VSQLAQLVRHIVVIIDKGTKLRSEKESSKTVFPFRYSNYFYNYVQLLSLIHTLSYIRREQISVRKTERACGAIFEEMARRLDFKTTNSATDFHT